MGRLNQLLAVEKSVREKTQRTVTEAYHNLQKGGLFLGLKRTYEPIDDDAVRLPDEYTKPQLDAVDLVDEALGELQKQWDLEATKDESNRSDAARADVKLPDGTVILENVPGTTLLYLEKQLEDVKTLIKAVPTLDPATDWEMDLAGGWKSTPVKTVRTQKIPRNHVLSKATDKHPEQVHLWHEDAPVGTWTTVKLSTAVRLPDKRGMLARVSTLQQAVKKAREEANLAPQIDAKIGDKIASFLLSD